MSDSEQVCTDADMQIAAKIRHPPRNRDRARGRNLPGTMGDSLPSIAYLNVWPTIASLILLAGKAASIHQQGPSR